MRIRDIEVQNYRSLKELKMSNLGSFVILVGKNGSGKSNILEALELFFVDLNIQSDYSKSFDAATWYDKRSMSPIEFIIKLELENDDLENILTGEILKRIDVGLEAFDKYLVIHRKIEVNLWKNVEADLGGILEIKEGKVSYIPKESEAKELQKKRPITPEIANLILVNINTVLKNSFKLIRSPRESAERPVPTIRPTIVDPESRSYLTNLASNPKDRDEELVWIEFQDEFLIASNKTLQSRGANLMFRIGDLFLPIELGGSGDQALMILMRQLLDKKPFYGIEEPETRFHHDFQRKVFSYLTKISQERQIFVATHSSVFVDKAFLKDTWFVTLEKKQTKVKKVETEDLKAILRDLGVMPSDFFLSNKILFVEGLTEKTVLPLISETVGIDLTDVTIIPTHGKGKGKYHLEVWTDAAKNTNLPIFFLLDEDAEKEIKNLEKKNLIDKDDYHLLVKEFEDYYSKDVLESIVLEMTKESKEEKGAEKEKELELKEPVADQIDSILKRKDWKVEVGSKVATSMTPDQIKEDMDEIIRFLRKITEK
jgi:AAA15 family ATPase/GTPase